MFTFHKEKISGESGLLYQNGLIGTNHLKIFLKRGRYIRMALN
jgi:hypothetical protein